MNKYIKYLVLNTLYYAKDKQVLEDINAIEVQTYHDELHEENSRYEWFACIPEIEEAYKNIRLSSEQLSKIEDISGESCQPHHAIMPNWDGSGDEFNPDSLDGLELLTNLKEIRFVDFSNISDFSHLFKVPLQLIDESTGIDEVTKEKLRQCGVTLGVGLS